MKKQWEITLWPNNQPPILIGYYWAKSEKDAKSKAVLQMNQEGFNISTKDLLAEIKSVNTSYQHWKKI